SGRIWGQSTPRSSLVLAISPLPALSRCCHFGSTSGRARHAGAAMTRNWEAFNAALRGRVPELAAELLGRPTIRAGNEWRWGRKGSLSVVIDGAKAGMWFDHEAGKGGGFAGLVAHTLGISRTAAFDWIADRIGMAARGDAPQFRDDHRARSGRESAAQLLPQ